MLYLRALLSGRMLGCVRCLHDVTANGSGVSSVIFPRGCFIKSSTEWSVKGEQTRAEYTARAGGIQNKNTAVLWIAPSLGNRGGKGQWHSLSDNPKLLSMSSSMTTRKYERCHESWFKNLISRRKTGTERGGREGERKRLWFLVFVRLCWERIPAKLRVSIKRNDRSACASPMSSNKNQPAKVTMIRVVATRVTVLRKIESEMKETPRRWWSY